MTKKIYTLVKLGTVDGVENQITGYLAHNLSIFQARELLEMLKNEQVALILEEYNEVGCMIESDFLTTI